MTTHLFKKALVPINSSDLSERVVQQAIKCVNSGMVEQIVLLNVWRADKIDYTKLHASEKEAKFKSEAQEILARYNVALKDNNIEANTISEGGNPSEVIFYEVEKGCYDLIIMGSRKLNKLQELAFGSVSDRITRLSSIPVLIVK